MNTLNALAILVYVLLSSGGLIALKIGSGADQQLLQIGAKFILPFSLPTMIGVFLYGFSFLIYMFLISKFELGYIIPVSTALVYIIIFTASYFLFKEAFTTFKVMGIVFIFIGILLLNINR